VLGSFRARISPRFSAIGLQLIWVNERLPELVQVAPDASLQVLRILQEALANVLKHAKAAAVTVTVGTETDTLIISVKDDGVGVETSTAGRGYGAVNMHRRAEMIGGSLNIAADATGTTVRLSVPLKISQQRL
jgi:signal transduction histidine kinase